jgi:hypothetical protein
LEYGSQQLLEPNFADLLSRPIGGICQRAQASNRNSKEPRFRTTNKRLFNAFLKATSVKIFRRLELYVCFCVFVVVVLKRGHSHQSFLNKECITFHKNLTGHTPYKTKNKFGDALDFKSGQVRSGLKIDHLFSTFPHDSEPSRPLPS